MNTRHFKLYLLLIFLFLFILPMNGVAQVEIWDKYEQDFTSSKDYENPLYEVKKFSVKFTSASGRVKNINGFWDDARHWKVRFAPDEKGIWTWESTCSDAGNPGLNQIKGSFTCTDNKKKQAIYKHGAIMHPKGTYYLTHADGTPFFWAGCTAWNGPLKSTEPEWDIYLNDRSKNGYNVIQFVTTQWRGGDKNSLGQVAFEGSGRIKINPEFFKHLDGKIDKINEYGLVAAPILLWALPTVQGRDLSPGYYLPEEEAILLARYMVARYGGNQVIWILGGDGKFTDTNEQRWKNIGRGVFGDEHPGLVSLHPSGGSWIGEAYAPESWLDIIGYQSGHNTAEGTLKFINKEPMAKFWDKLPPRPYINMEPVYEEINPKITAADVRNASYWSLLNTPTAGITYGANGIWPWLRTGEYILNHATKGENVSRWQESLKLPGSVQIGYLANFMRTLDWYKLKPAPALLVEQPSDKNLKEFVAVSQSDDGSTVLAYLPKAMPIKLYNILNKKLEGHWFNPVTNQVTKANITSHNGIMEITPPTASNDLVLVLKLKK